MFSATPQQGGPHRTSHHTAPAAADPVAEQDRDVWDALVPDPSGREPLGDEPEFAEILEGMVADFAPRVFAVVQVYGERVDGRIAAWGLAFEDHAAVFGMDGRVPMTSQTPEDALPGFAWGRHITTRLVWVNPAAATPADCDEDVS
ncbi:MAG: hypothetical protein M3332_18545 [Actinomycetota bacterium]|nr:hypothetical protein [Actinomycetota bacterium]